MSDLNFTEGKYSFEKPKSREDPFVKPEWARNIEEDTHYILIESNGEKSYVNLEDRSYWIIGRLNFVQIKTLHDSISRQNSVIVYAEDGNFYLIDLKSAHGTFIDGKRIVEYTPTKVDVDQPFQFGKEKKTYYIKKGKIPVSKKRSGDDISSENKRQKNEPKQVRALHLLLKHKRSRNPKNWKGETITRTIDEAIELLKKYREEIVNDKVSFEDMAKKYSDCSSAKRNGDLGYFARGAMMKPFEDASFNLEIGEISEIVETDSGVHIIKRIG